MAKSAKIGRGLQDFRAAHDKNFIIPERIRAGLKELGDGWEYEGEFQKRTGISTTDFARFRDQFEEFFVIVGTRNTKRVWAGTKELAKKLREMAT